MQIENQILQNECPICLETLSSQPEGDLKLARVIAKTDCSHFFHHFCLSQHLERGINRNCPICRHPLTSETVSKIVLDKENETAKPEKKVQNVYEYSLEPRQPRKSEPHTHNFEVFVENLPRRREKQLQNHETFLKNLQEKLEELPQRRQQETAQHLKKQYVERDIRDNKNLGACFIGKNNSIFQNIKRSAGMARSLNQCSSHIKEKKRVDFEKRMDQMRKKMGQMKKMMKIDFFQNFKQIETQTPMNSVHNY